MRVVCFPGIPSISGLLIDASDCSITHVYKFCFCILKGPHMGRLFIGISPN